METMKQSHLRRIAHVSTSSIISINTYEYNLHVTNDIYYIIYLLTHLYYSPYEYYYEPSDLQTKHDTTTKQTLKRTE